MEENSKSVTTPSETRATVQAIEKLQLCTAANPKLFPFISFRCIDVPPVVERCEEKGGALKDKEENANNKEEELTKGENNREGAESGNNKPVSESIVCPEHIELVKTTKQSRSQNA